ncbi:MAG TPA: TMEM175 family protein [Longimicrobiaceae bacterium]|nr:TMEM175 family protein [Longimicrobiaceae bacterium]
MTRTTESIRWRGGQVTRIEALTDAVFGFAITLLVVSLEVPGTFDELVATMRGFVAFSCSFALLILVWHYHYRLFSRYDLEDGYTVFLNSVLLFVVLFYVYPLKFVFSAWLGGDQERIFSAAEQIPLMMTIYAAGFIAVFLVFALLYHHAWALRNRLRLTGVEALEARAHVGSCLVMVAAGALSILIAQTAPPQYAGFLAGISYFLIGPAQYANGWYFARRRERLIRADSGPVDG